MESQDNTDRYEAIPFQMMIPAAPLPSKGVLSSKLHGMGSLREDLPAQSIITAPTSIREAQRHSEEMLRHCRHRVMHCHDLMAVYELIEIHPFFLQHPWVREQLERFKKRHMKKRGRRLDSFTVSPIVVYGLVRACMDYGFSPDVPSAYKWLSEWFNCLTADSIRVLYNQAKTDDRYRPLLLEFSEHKEILSAEEVSNRLSHVETLQPGGSITRTATSGEGDSIEVTFTAK